MTFATLQLAYQESQDKIAVLSLEKNGLELRLDSTISQLETTTSQLASSLSEQERLKLMIKRLQHMLFGKSSERRVREDDPRQGLLFELPQEPKVDEEVQIESHSPRIRQKLEQDDQEESEGSFPGHLRREEEYIDEKPEGYGEDELECNRSRPK
jgi:hypothetical protein